ncbi:NmrA family NAD(P)-binding protein [Micromonospora craniellae]|uniref:NmrA family NAD(P)-binding protein n=1 Tax=Micromonospora craniellae TaxID=2294034 RepID=UPI001F3DCCAC|nr:NmrA family NAD(P)-binding protein [Micromonospora craniellae]
MALGRETARLADLAGRGVTVRQADYDDPESLRVAFAGAEKLMFVSGSEVGRRVAQHRNVVAAATEAGVGLVVYTSIPKADTSSLILATEHRATEQTDEGHTNRVYELGGPAFTLGELAAEVSRQSGREVGYLDLPVERYVEVLVDADRGAAEGELYVEGDDLATLIGRPPVTLAEAIRTAL